MRKYDKKFASFTDIGNGFHASVRINMTERLMQKKLLLLVHAGVME